MEGSPNFEEFRRKQGLSQSEMADRLGISQGLWSQIERGRAPLSMTVKQRLIDGFGADAAALFDGLAPKDMLRYLVEAWQAYSDARDSMERLVAEIGGAALALRPFQDRLEQWLKVHGATKEARQAATLKKHLDTLIGEIADEDRQRRVPPEKRLHPAFRALPTTFPMTCEALDALFPLLEAANGLSEDDVELLAAVARRLVKPMNTRNQMSSVEC